jgi:hypothetical protein
MAVQQLNLFLRSKSGDDILGDKFLPRNPQVELTSDSKINLKLTYSLKDSGFRVAEIYGIKSNLNKHDLNKELRTMTFVGQKGDVAFKVIDIDVNTFFQQNIIFHVKYTYLVPIEKTYFGFIPSELLPLIGSKLKDPEDVKSMCAGFGTCSNALFWQQMFKYSFRRTYNKYIRSGQVNSMNKDTYLARLIRK